MFPDVGEFNLVMAGLATFAATVGYACTRRLSTSSASARPDLHLLQQQTESDMQVDIDNDVKPADDEKESMTMEHDSISPVSVPPVTQAPPTATTNTITVSASVPSVPATTLLTPVRRESLKRKAPEDGFDEPNVEDRGYPYNLANIYPNKRSRTPSSDSVASTPSISSQLTREPSPTLESTIDTTFDAVVVTHMETSSTSVSASAVSEPCSTIDPAPTPATEPPTSPSPVPSPKAAVLEIQELEDATPAPARSPTPVSTPLFAPSPLFTAVARAPVGLALAADTEKVESKIPMAEAPSLPPAPSPLPAARKPFGFAAFASQDAFAPARPTTPKSTFTSTPSAFAAFAGAASPFAAAAALNRPATAAPSLFSPTPTSFFRLKPATNTVNSGAFVLPNANIFGAPAAGAHNIFGASAAAGNIFGNGGGGSKDVKPTELVAAEKFLDDVLGSKTAVVPANLTGADVAKQEDDAQESTKNVSGDAETREKEERERGEREKEEGEKEAVRRVARAKAEEEMRLQEAREKQVRKEAKLRERKTGHAIVEANATAPTEKFIPLTGEEDEDVEMEQRAVKLYIKRGDRPFSEGIPGLIKLLVNRTTAEERILFRREPLLKVSMNVRVQPTVRITFVPEENVLRCILKEMVPPAEGEDGVPKQEVAIYVIKPARAGSKQDFKAFAEGLMERSQLKEGAEKLKTRSA